MKILYGKVIADDTAGMLTSHIKVHKLKPVLAIIQIGEHKESDTYVARKKDFAERIGAKVIHRTYAADESEDVIVEEIKKLDQDKKVHGIIVQVPIPGRFTLDRLTGAISKAKDVDGMNKENMDALYSGQPAQISAAAEATRMIVFNHFFNLTGKKVVVVGDSLFVGKPTARILQNEGANVTVCNADTEDVPAITRKADIVVVAVGKPKLLGVEYFSPGQFVIDIGTNVIGYNEELKKNILVGDVDFDKVKDIVAAITPVPGGVGPVTIAALFTKVVMNA